MFRSPDALLRVEEAVGVYFPFEPRQEDLPCRRCVRCGILNPRVESVSCHPGLQNSLSFARGRIGHCGLRYPEQSDLDCLAAFGCCSSLKAESRRAWELSRLAAGHRGAASGLDDE